MTHSRPALAVACSLLLIAMFLTPLTLDAQEAHGGGRMRIAQIRATAYTLKHVSPEHAEKMLNGLISADARMMADPRSGQLLVVANDAVHKQVSDLCAMFDVPAVKTVGANEITRVITLKNRPIESVLQAVGQLQPFVISAISATNTLIARGTPEQIADLESLVATLDVAADVVELECWILAHNMGEAISKHPALSALEGELAKTGLHDYGSLSHMKVRGISGESFRSAQDFSGSRVKQTSLSGRVHLSTSESARISFDLRIVLGLEIQESIGGPEQSGSFTLSTELKTQVGKLVVVGLAPTGNEKSQPLVLVMRVGK